MLPSFAPVIALLAATATSTPASFAPHEPPQPADGITRGIEYHALPPPAPLTALSSSAADHDAQPRIVQMPPFIASEDGADLGEWASWEMLMHDLQYCGCVPMSRGKLKMCRPVWCARDEQCLQRLTGKAWCARAAHAQD